MMSTERKNEGQTSAVIMVFERRVVSTVALVCSTRRTKQTCDIRTLLLRSTGIELTTNDREHCMIGWPMEDALIMVGREVKAGEGETRTGKQGHVRREKSRTAARLGGAAFYRSSRNTLPSPHTHTPPSMDSRLLLLHLPPPSHHF
jgi:hypothetical protein